MTGVVSVAADVRTRLLAVLLLSAAAFTQSGLAPLVPLAAGAFLWALWVHSPRNLVLPAVLLLLAGGQVFVLRAFFGAETPVLLDWGWFTPSGEDALAAGRATLRLTAVVFVFAAFIASTAPEELTRGLTGLRVPYRYAMLAGLALRFLPLLQWDLRAIVEAQAARGVAVHGWRGRVQLLLPVLGALLFRSLKRADEMAVALELRGYGAAQRRTFAGPTQTGVRRAAAVPVALLALALSFAAG
ncbi:MAG: hypothetical protein Kow00122_19770 [Thermoleophilia bacterium]